MTRRVEKPVDLDKLHKVAGFLEVAQGLTECAALVRRACDELEHHRNVVALSLIKDKEKRHAKVRR